MQHQNIMISAIAPGGMAFGYAADGRGVYVPKSLAKSANVQPFDTYNAALIPNPYRPEKTELMAIRIEQASPLLPAVPLIEAHPNAPVKPNRKFRELTPGQITIEALDIVKAGGVWTAPALVEEICGSGWRERYPNILAHVSVYLRKGFQADELSRCEVYQHPGQSNPSAVLYAVDWKDLL